MSYCLDESGICQCKSTRGQKLYDIYREWSGATPTYEDLTETDKTAWVMSALGKRKPVELQPQADEAVPKAEKPAPKPRGKRASKAREDQH